MKINSLTESAIKDKLAGTANHPPASPYPRNVFDRPRRRAGVLIPFTRIRSDWHLLFIRRAEFEDDHHGGQVAFPGGGMEKGDGDIVATALRETNEETGLHPDDVRLLGRLTDVVSITNYLVTPVVGAFSWPYPLTKDPREVARIFTIPLAWLADPENRRTQTRSVEGQGSWPVIYYDRYDGELLWGFSAGVTRHLIKALQ